MRSFSLLAAVGLAIAISGCSDYDVILKKQTEMDARLEQLVQGSAATNTRLTEMNNEVKEMQARIKSQAADLEGLKSAERQVRELNSSMAGSPRHISEPSSPKIEVVNKDATPPEKDAGPQEAYMKAFGLFSSNKYNEAVAAFEAFIKAYPTNEYAGNAQYWIGECHYTQHDYPLALEAFNKVVSNYPKGHKVPDAMLKTGFTLISMNETVKAKATLQALVDKYPKSQAAAKAKERLARF